MKIRPKNHLTNDPDNYHEKHEKGSKLQTTKAQQIHQKRSRAVPQFIR